MFCGNVDDLVGLKLNLDQRKALENSVTSSFSLIQGPPGLHFQCYCSEEETSENRDNYVTYTRIDTFISYLLYLIFTGTGKTFTGVVLISIFCSINKEICAKGGKKRIVLFCGPSNKSVDLVTGIVKVFHYYFSFFLQTLFSETARSIFIEISDLININLNHIGFLFFKLKSFSSLTYLRFNDFSRVGLSV